MTSHSRSGFRAHLAVSAVLILAGACTFAEDAVGAATPEPPVLEQYVERANDYVRLRTQATAAALPVKETASPDDARERSLALAAAIRAKRGAAKPGDVFGDAIGPITKIVRRDWQQRSAAERAALAREVPDVAAPAVNAAYPGGLPIATFPPALLEALPQLPKQLEYRFAGPHLILHDVEADLVVDVAPNVLGGPAQ